MDAIKISEQIVPKFAIQEAQHEKTMIAASTAAEKTSKVFQNQEKFETAMIAARQYRSGTFFSIRTYGDFPQNQRFELAMIVAAQDRSGTFFSIRNYGDLTQDQRFKLAMIAAAQNETELSSCIKDYGDLTQHQRFELAKIAAMQNGTKLSSCIKNYGDLTQDQRFELATIAAVQNGRGTSQYIENYGDLTAEQRKQIFMICSITAFMDTGFSLAEARQILDEFLPSIRPPIQSFLENIKKDQQDLAKHMYVCFYMQSGNPLTKVEENTLKELVNMRNLKEQKLLWGIFILAAKDPRYREFFNKEKISPPALLSRIILTKWSLSQNELCSLLSSYLQKNNKRFFKDRLGISKDLLHTIIALEQASDMEDWEKITIMNTILSFDLETDLSERGLRQFLSIVYYCCLLKMGKALLRKNIEECHVIFNQHLQTALCLEDDDVKNLHERYWDLETLLRIPSALITYLAPLLSLHDLEINKTIREFSKAILNGTIHTDRYDTTKSPHLSMLGAKILEKWKIGTHKDLQIVEKLDGQEVNFYTFFQQKIRIDKHLPNSPQDLLDYLADPNTKVYSEIATLCRSLCESKEAPKKLLRQLQKLVPEESDFYNDLEMFLSPKKTKKGDLSLIDTDNWQDLFLSGTEVPESCQRINGIVDQNKCLMAFVIDGKNRMMAIMDQNGQIIARCIVRLLLQEDNTPAIFQERIYPSTASIEMKTALESLTQEKGRFLEIPVFSSSKDKIGKTLRSLGSPAAYEYSDGAAESGYGGVHQSGVFKISI